MLESIDTQTPCAISCNVIANITGTPRKYPSLQYVNLRTHDCSHTHLNLLPPNNSDNQPSTIRYKTIQFNTLQESNIFIEIDN